jgi:YVTN family beta-propeller protein
MEGLRVAGIAAPIVGPALAPKQRRRTQMRIPCWSLALVLAAACRTGAAVETSTSGTLVVLDKADATARLYDISSTVSSQSARGGATAREVVARTLRGVVPTGTGPHEVACRRGLAVVADYGAQADGHTLTVIDTRTAEVLRKIDLGEHRGPHGIDWIDDDHVMVTVERNRAILRVDVDRGKVLDVHETGQEVSHMLALAPDRSRAYVANIASDTVSAIDLSTGEVLAQIATGKGPEAIDVTPDGREVWVGNRGGDSVSVIDTRTLAVTTTLECAKFPIRLKITPDGRYALVSCAQSGDLAAFDVATRGLVRRIPMQISAIERGQGAFGGQFGESPVPIGILVRPDGKRAWIANTNADLVTEIDLESWSIVARLPTGRQPDGLGWAAN